MHPWCGYLAVEAVRGGRRVPGRDPDTGRTSLDLLNDEVLQVRQEAADFAPESAIKVHIGHPADAPTLPKIFARAELLDRPQQPAQPQRRVPQVASL